MANLPVLTSKKWLKVRKHTEQEGMENVDPPGNATGHLASGHRLKDKAAMVAVEVREFDQDLMQ